MRESVCVSAWKLDVFLPSAREVAAAAQRRLTEGEARAEGAWLERGALQRGTQPELGGQPSEVNPARRSREILPKSRTAEGHVPAGIGARVDI